MNVCVKCVKAVPRQDSNAKIQCKLCNNWLHTACVGLKEKDVKYLRSQDKQWACNECDNNEWKKADNGSQGRDSSTPTIAPTVGEMYKLLLTINEEIKQLRKANQHTEEEFGKSLNLAHSKLDDNSDLLLKQAETIKSCMGVIEELRNENSLLKKQLTDLSLQIDDQDQYSRRNSVEIYGIPEAPNENTYEIVKNVGRALDKSITSEMIDVCHRLKKPTNQSSAGIIVRFVRRIDKDEFLFKRKVKRSLNAVDIGFNKGEPIYVNQSLSANRKVVFAQARRIKREKGFAYLWVDKVGNIKLRKKEGDKYVYTLKSLDDVKCLA